MKTTIIALALIFAPALAQAQLSANQRLVLLDFVERSDPETVVTFIEADSAAKVAYLKAYAAARREQIITARTDAAAAKAEVEAVIAEKDAEIAVYDNVEQ